MLTPGAYLHDLSPFLLRVTESLGLRWYGLAYAIGFLYAWWLMRWMSRRGMTPLSEQRIADAMITLVLGVIVGGRLGYVFIYDRALLWEFSSNFPWWGALAINKGGMAYHGAVVGVMVAGWWIARGVKRPDGAREGAVPWRHVMDVLAFSCTVGLGLGRVANFINGELLGKVVARPGDPAPWWSVHYPQELLEKRGDVALSDAQVDSLIALLDQYAPGMQSSDSIARVIELLQSGPANVSGDIARRLEPLLSARHPSQLYQAFFEGIVLTAVLWLVWRVARKPGVVGAWFLITYGVLRVIAEFFRLPDAQFAEGRPMGLSRGQWLSALMVVGGAAALAWIARRADPLMGGWARSKRA